MEQIFTFVKHSILAEADLKLEIEHSKSASTIV